LSINYIFSHQYLYQQNTTCINICYKNTICINILHLQKKKEIERPRKDRPSVILPSTMNAIYVFPKCGED